ncbi:hypothetical protein QFZ88_004074 [Mesorhizobium sp. YL-MeA3-2017]|jgi:hypothetical protein|nr:hypothetical protein [Mesorhizobium sp. YL-MeA3-2017]
MQCRIWRVVFEQVVRVRFFAFSELAAQLPLILGCCGQKSWIQRVERGFLA